MSIKKSDDLYVLKKDAEDSFMFLDFKSGGYPNWTDSLFRAHYFNLEQARSYKKMFSIDCGELSIHPVETVVGEKIEND